MLVSTSQAQPAGHPEQYHLDREWAVEGNMDAMQGSRDMVIGPMTDSFVQILHQIHDPDSHGTFLYQMACLSKFHCHNRLVAGGSGRKTLIDLSFALLLSAQDLRFSKQISEVDLETQAKSPWRDSKSSQRQPSLLYQTSSLIAATLKSLEL